MISLSKFIGEIVSGIAKARVTADMQSVQISEQYHSDPYIKQLPVPRYTIDEAEIEVPVIVCGLQSDEGEYRRAAEAMTDIIGLKMPRFLESSFNYNLSRLTSQGEKTKKATEKEASGNGFCKAYREAVARITERVKRAFSEYLESYNYSMIKLLDFEEFLREQTGEAIEGERSRLIEPPFPFAAAADVINGARYVANLLFFEFTQLIGTSEGVQVDIMTSNMNEYDDNGCVMKIKLKLSEQDISVQTELRTDKRTRRFLTLA